MSPTISEPAVSNSKNISDRNGTQTRLFSRLFHCFSFRTVEIMKRLGLLKCLLKYGVRAEHYAKEHCKDQYGEVTGSGGDRMGNPGNYEQFKTDKILYNILKDKQLKKYSMKKESVKDLSAGIFWQSRGYFNAIGLSGSALRMLIIMVTFSLFLTGVALYGQGDTRIAFENTSGNHSGANNLPSGGEGTLPKDASSGNHSVASGNWGAENARQGSYVQNIEKSFYPQKMKADILANRFIPLLPRELRQQTSWRVDPGRNSFTLTGPIQSIAIAEQLIPKMDANLQLTDGYVDVGLAVPSEKVQRPQNQNSASVREDQTGAVPQKMEQYYDPTQNRYVRVAWQSEDAILPSSDPQNNPKVFGSETGAPDQNSVSDNSLDLVAYQCSPADISQTEFQLKQKFSKHSGITVASNVSAGRIFILASRADQRLVGGFLGSMKIYPVSDSLRQTDTRINDGTVYPVTGQSVRLPEIQTPSGSNGSNGQLSYSPSRKKVQELEKIAVALFGSRFQAVNRHNTGNQTPSEAARTSYRFFKRPNPNEPVNRTCDVEFDPLNQKIFIHGDNAICAQMYQLFLAVEASPQTQGNVRRFISIKQADPKKIREIFDIYNKKRRQGIPGQSSLSGERRSSIGFADYVQSGASDLISQKNDFLSSSEKDPIRQVAYQEETGGGMGALGGTDSSALQDGQGNFGSGHGVGVVQDYIPQILPELDVVIIDAPESEYKRIENMIREIEELAKLAEPTVEIYNLKHINCVMLQGILQELHSEMFMTKQGRVIIFAMQNPNAILLVGWGQAFTSMKDLINTFDQPIQESGSMFRVVHLQYASATETATQLTAYFPQPQPVSGGVMPRIRVFPDARTNSLVIQAAPNDLAEIQRILVELDVNKAAPKLLVKTFKMKNLLAQDMKQTLMNAILPSVSGTSESGAAKYPILQILSVDADSKRLIESGIMTDVNVTADPYNNQLVVTAPEDCMELIEKLIQLLDIAPAKAQIKIFRVVNGDATQMEKTLRSLLPTGQGTMPSLPNAEGEETFVPVRLSVDTRTNCIIAAAAPKDLKIIEALVISLDRKDYMERKELIVPLRNVQALSVAKAIDDYLTRKQKLEIDSEALSINQMFEAQVIVIPESITNSLIISATPKYLTEIQELVKEFDRDPPQVVIQVLIGEVTLNDHEEFGIEAGLQDQVAFDRSIITSTTSGSASGIPGYDMISTNSIGNNMNAANQTTVAGQVLNTLGMGRTSTASNFGGLVLSASSRSVEATLRALMEKSRLQVLSRPQITAMDNQQAFILVGQRVPRVDKANMTDYGISSSVTDANVGLILLVTPRVSDDGRVIMEIGVEKSSLAGDSDAVPIFVADNQVIKSQSINTTQAMTAVSAQDGETVMLGGLISTSKNKIRHGIPCISDLPWVGWLFRYDQYTESRKELLIVMTPRIVRDQEDIEEIKRVEASRMNWCLADAMALNGNMGLFDPLSGQCPDWGNCPPKTIPFHHTNDTMKDLDKVKPYCPDKDYPEKKTDPKTGAVKRTQKNPFTGAEYEVNRRSGADSHGEINQNGTYNRQGTPLRRNDVIEVGPVVPTGTVPAPTVFETQEPGELSSPLPANSLPKSNDPGGARQSEFPQAPRKQSYAMPLYGKPVAADQTGNVSLPESSTVIIPTNYSDSPAYASSPVSSAPNRSSSLNDYSYGMSRDSNIPNISREGNNFKDNPSRNAAGSEVRGSEVRGNEMPRTQAVPPEQLKQIYQQGDARNASNVSNGTGLSNGIGLSGASRPLSADQIYAPLTQENRNESRSGQSGFTNYSESMRLSAQNSRNPVQNGMNDSDRPLNGEMANRGGMSTAREASPYQNLTNVRQEDWHQIQQTSYNLPKSDVKLY